VTDYPADFKGHTYFSHSFCARPVAFHNALTRYGDRKGRDIMDDQASPQTHAVLELVEALSCSNVHHEILQPASSANARRIRAGKLPIYETRVLTVDVPGKAGTGIGKGAVGERAGPREHLRRGHIRRLQDGRKVWVSAAVIGAGNAGKIDKTYRIRVA
jgi:hypothetical protein